MNDQEARQLAAQLTDIDIERLEYALGKEREAREIQGLRAARVGLTVRFAS